MCSNANQLIVGLPAIFWFHMNQGIYFRDIKKTFLTICNIFVLGIAFAIVRFRSHSLLQFFESLPCLIADLFF